ncbi:MAG: O-antigen ligase family protein [Candidatus Paceibacterota bacterium]|jgi:O-antigen ligase/tetratricopeptide (TPR) repeat protein
MNKNNIIKYSILTGLWAILLIPFFVANSMFFPYISGKNFAFRIIIEIIFALWVYLAFVDVKYRPKFSWLTGAIGLFVLVMAVADFFAVNPAKAFWSNYERMDGFITLAHLAMYFVVFSSVMRTEKIWLWFLRSSVIMSMIMVILTAKEWLSTGIVRVSTTLGNPIYVAVYFLFNVFFVLILLYKDVISKYFNSPKPLKTILSKWLTYLYGIAAILCVWGIWRTSTRGVILGLLGGLLVTSLFILIFEKNNKFTKNISLSIFVAILVIIGGFFALKNTDFVRNNTTLGRFAQISWNDIQGQGQARQFVWPMAIKGFQDKPILGWGQDGFNYVFNKYYDPRMYNQEQWFDRAHNTPLDVLVAGGILGLLSYLLIFASALALIWKRRRVLGITDAGILIGLLAGYFFQNLFVFDNLISYMFFFTTLSYIHSRSTEMSEENAPMKNPKERTGISPDMAHYVVAPLVIVTSIACLWYFNARPINTNLNLIRSLQGYQEGPSKNLEYFKKVFSYNSFGLSEAREQLSGITLQVVASNSDASFKQEFADFTFAQMEEQLKKTPDDARYQFFMGVFLDNMHQYQMAIPFLEKAIEQSPKKQTMMFELVKAYSYVGEKEKALALAKKAYELETKFADAKNDYIAAAILNNDNALMRELMGTTTTSTSDMVVRAYLIIAQDFLNKNDIGSAIATINKAVALVPGFKAQGDQVIKDIQSGKVR